MKFSRVTVALSLLASQCSAFVSQPSIGLVRNQVVALNAETEDAPVPAELPPPVRALEIAQGHWKSQSLRAFVSTGLADAMGKHNKAASAADLAKDCDLNELAVYRLLRFLATFDVVNEMDDQSFTLGPIGEVCVSSHPESAAGKVMWEAGPALCKTWMCMDEFLKTNVQCIESSLGSKDLWQYFQTDTDSFASFQNAMTSYSMEQAMFLSTPPLSPTFDLSSFETICDLGCAEGAAALALNKRFPDAKYILADLPESVERIDSSTLPDNFEKEGIDFLKSVPKADAYFLKFIIHDWDDEKSGVILRNILDANPKATIFLAEFGPMPGPNVPHTAKGFDLHMGIMLNAMERTQEEYDTLFANNGLARVNTHMLAGGEFPLYIQELSKL